ncbi:unnamed protein product [Urochloa decumbens]|uniref:Uncharacterized protein n=1 Tax=Urochloa decumbens TaxID=240449 RepID=A0ABC9AEG4_9POAL
MEDMKVRVVESSFVAPSERTPRKGLWLVRACSLDLLIAKRGHTPTFYLFHNNDAASDFFDVARLKAAMAKALVAFYPLAGRLGVDSSGRVEIDCNGKGALFVVARADDITIDEIKDVKPSPELRRQLVPRIEPSSVVMGVQVTFFKCGGVALGTALHHASIDLIRVPTIDATSAFHFFQTWSALSRDGDHAAVELPCHDRTLLRARSPPIIHPDALSMFHPKLTFSNPSGPITTQVFSISKDQVTSLKRGCGGASTFCALSALVWRCACAARRLPPDVEARLTFSANIRRRVTPPLPERYFGNAYLRVGVAATVQDVIAPQALASVAGRIGGAIRRMDDEMVRSAIDYFEAEEMSGHWAATGTRPMTELHVTSWLGMPVYDADFGWGPPLVMSRAESNLGGFVHLVSDGPAYGGGGVRVITCMEAANVKELEHLLYQDLARCI